MEWNKTFGEDGSEFPESIQQTTDGGYIILGTKSIMNKNQSCLWLIKTDNKGKKQWDKTYGTHGYDWGYDIQKTNDGAYVFTGGTDTSTKSEHILDVGLVKIKEDGFIEWEKDSFPGNRS